MKVGVFCTRAFYFVLDISGISHAGIPPDTFVMARIGIGNFGSFQPVGIAQGERVRRANRIPSAIG